MGIKNNGYRGATGDVGGRSGKIRQHETREDAILAWHFVSENRRLGYDATHLQVKPGYIYYTDSPIELCQSGMHASVDPFDALGYANGGYLCQVAIWGDVEIAKDKIAGRNREVIEAHDINRELRLFACWCVRQALSQLNNNRLLDAIAVYERFANGQATKKELHAARTAAWDAASSAASAAARDSARTAQRAEFNRMITERFKEVY